jgi:hypothetical protein
MSGHDRARTSRQVALVVLTAIVLFLSGAVKAPAAPGGQKKDAKQAETTRLTIEVTGGDDKKPVSDASVYLKYVVIVKHGRDQKLELNLKTNQEGKAHSPEIPQGKALIQIVAPGWKTFGQYYDLQEEEQTIPIHLDRPATKWY